MSDFAQNLESGFRQYIYPCLTGMAFALVVLLGIVLFFSAYCSACRPRRGSVEWIALRERRTRRGFSLPLHPMERRDALPLLLITVLYAFSAFFRLGSLSAPQSALDLGDNGSVEIELSEQVYLTKLMYFSNLGTGSYNLEVSADGETWYTLWARKDEEGDVTGYYWADAEGYSPSYALPQKYNDLFKWLEIEPENPQNVRYLRLTGKADKGLLELGELALYSAVGESRDPLGRLNVSPAPLSARSGTDLTGITVSGADALFDEQDTVPAQSTWYNSAYFDEIYHARTALEHLEGVYPYEVSHPPLGKLIIGLGIRVFGMTPFGWRFMGTLFGVCMLPILYVFLKNLFGRTAVAACGTCLFAFDFMHLTQTRIATIDTYGVFFILLMYFFLYRYLTLPAGTPFRRGALPLFLSGLFWGIGAASKWTVIYGAAGLAVLYFIGLHAKWRAWPVGEQAPRFAPWLVKTLLLSALCFVAIPACIYCLSYLPYAQAKGVDLSFANTLAGARESLPVLIQNLWGRYTGGEGFQAASIPKDSLPGIMADNQWFMLTYHEGVHAAHPYSSRWYQWLVDARPILYYLDNKSGAAQELKAAFGCFNNPIVCWAGLLAMLTLLLPPLLSLLSTLTRPLRALLARLLPGGTVRCDGVPALDFLAPDGRGIFILIGYLSQFLPWVFIGRTTFEYHYFPSTVFLVLAVSYVMDGMIRRRPDAWRGPVYGLTAGAVGLYVLFYPVLIGLMTPTWYTSNILKWLPSWPF